MKEYAVVTGAGGFIGAHLVKALKELGYYVRGADVKFPDFEPSIADNFLIADLRDPVKAREAVWGADVVFALAADMGGIGYLATNDAEILTNSMQISLNTFLAVENFTPTGKIIYTSSACVYPEYRQLETDVVPLQEDMAYPADPDTLYGWEKLTSEKILMSMTESGRLDARIARLHNIYGPSGTWKGGKEKAPAALCRKVAEAEDGGSIEIWGDGKQTRSFCYVDDCIEGLLKLQASDYTKPLNIGSDRLVTIDQLADMVIDISAKVLNRIHVPGPVGVRGRNSDNLRCQEVLDWAPQISLEEGLAKTYAWINEQVMREKTANS